VLCLLPYAYVTMIMTSQQDTMYGYIGNGGYGCDNNGGICSSSSTRRSSSTVRSRNNTNGCSKKRTKARWQ
jgi:hypothetical protein